MSRWWRRAATAVAAAAFLVLGTAAISAPAQAASHGRGHASHSKCAPIRPASDFYEAGRVASELITVPRSSCTTISVSNIRDAANAADRCQTFLVGFFPADGSEATYTEPVTACSVPSSTRTVLASNVPDGAVYRVLYNVDYIDPAPQQVRYTIWH